MINYFLLEELRSRFDNELDIKDKLEGKATNTITVAGIMAAIFMGFGSTILDNVDITSGYFIPAITLLMLELIATLATVIFAIKAYRLGTYQFPLVRSEFLSDNKVYDKNKIMQFKQLDDDTYYETAKKYLMCIKYNQKENDRKAAWVDRAQFTLIGAIGLIPIFAGIVVLSQFQNIESTLILAYSLLQ
jgi:hypothetical protein